MDVTSFFNLLRAGSFSDKVPVLFFRGTQEYPLLLCSLFIDRLRVIVKGDIESLDFHAYDKATITSKCVTTFLGQRAHYWMYNLILLDAPQLRHAKELLASYEGPNCLIFFALQTSNIAVSRSALIVDIPDMCTKEQFLALATFYDGQLPEGVVTFAQHLFTAVPHVPFDTACIMLQYARLLGTHQAVFAKRWLGHLIIPEHSLFTLSQHLFSKNGRAFFTVWSSLVDEYSEVFWTSFWSEQMWRAVAYIRLMQSNNRVEAEKISYRLPFVFKNKGWQRWDPAELIAAHSFLCATDGLLKNGGTVLSLELFYAKLFADDFAVK